MNVFISLLRGINVGGKNRIRMPDLKDLYEQLGYKDVQTYLQSGNVVFSHSGKPVDHSAAIHRAIKKTLGHDVQSLVFPKNQFLKIVMPKKIFETGAVDESFLHVTFLLGTPSAEFPVDLPKTGEENAVMVGDHIYVFCPHGYGRTKLNNNYFERKLKVFATTRNWRTVQALRTLVLEPKGVNHD